MTEWLKSKVLNQKIRSISAFDLDHTLFSENSSYRFGKYLCDKKLLSLHSLAFIVGCNIRHKIGLLPITKLHESAFQRLFFGRSSLVVRQWAKDFLTEQFEKLLYLPAIIKLRQAQEAGHLTVILSSTPDFLVEPIAQQLKVPLWDSTQYEIDQNNQFCGIKKLLLGENKALILEQLGQKYGVSKQDVYAYSDSHLDLPFLMAAGTKYGVNPNRKLRSICRQNNWAII